MLEIRHLRKHFGNKVVLKDITLTINKGEVVCIIGQSGHGKSVIIKNIMGLIVPDGGEILFEGEVISSPTMRPEDFSSVRKRFGMLFQGAALFDSMTVGENIAFPLREHTTLTTDQINKIIADNLEMVGLQNIEHVMPAELSGGMRSRVGLARAIAMKPEVMLYDEPTSALDPIMSDKIDNLIVDLRDKLQMTSVVITHDIASTYKIADKVAMLHEGRIIFEGTPAELRASRDPYVKKFIKGERKHFYAVQGQEKFQDTFNASKVRENLFVKPKKDDFHN